jgi:hypothetical protein
MGTPKQWAIADVAEATAYSTKDGTVLFQLKNLKTSGLENSAKTVYARGGRGNAKIVGFSSDREAKVKLQDAVFTNAVLAIMTGNDLVTGAANVYKSEILIVDANAVTLTKTPVGGTLIGLYKLNDDGSFNGDTLEKVATSPTAGQYTLSAKAIAFSTGEFENGDRVQAFYLMTTDASGVTIKVSSDKFAGAFKLVLDCMVVDTYTKLGYAAQIIIPSCKAEDNWSFSFQAGGEPAVFDMPIEILKPSNSNDMWTMTVYDEEAST